MTKLEIFNETVEHYSEGLNTRGFELNQNGVTGGCKYLTADNKMCAVGRCCIVPQTDWYGGVVIGIQDKACQPVVLEAALKTEYRGHPVKFWAKLQEFHDCADNFGPTGYSAAGLKEIEQMRLRIEEGAYDDHT